MGNLWRELWQRARSLQRDPGYAAMVVITLAACIAANTAIFAIVNAVLLRPLPVPEAERIVLMSNRYPRAGVSTSFQSGAADYYDRQRDVTAFAEQALFRDTDRTVDFDGRPEQVPAMLATPTLFPLLRVRAALGRTFTAAEGEVGSQHRVVLSHGLWRQMFGGRADAVGQSVRIDGRPHEVVGVLPASFSFVNPEIRMWLPLAFSPAEKEQRHNNDFHHIGRLKPGADLAQAQAQVDALNRANLERFPQFKEILQNAGFHTKAEPLATMLVSHVEGSLYMLWAGAGFVLLIGALNLANLALARGQARSREMASRLALGATRGAILRQALIESALLALTGAAAGLGAGWLLLRSLASLGLDRFPRAHEVTVDGSTALVAVTAASLVSVVMSLLPLWQTSPSMALAAVLREGGRGGSEGSRARRLRQALVAGQVAFGFLLLMGAGLLLASFRNLLESRPGYDAQSVWTASTELPLARYNEPARRRVFLQRTLEAIRALPGVEAAGATTMIPLGSDSSDGVIFAEGYQMKPGESLISPYQARVTPGYFEAMRVGLVRGRTFTAEDHENAPASIVIDERLAAKFWPGQDPIGRRMYQPQDRQDLMKVDANTQWLRVVGVVRSTRVRNLAGDDNPVGAYFFPHAQIPTRSFTFTVRMAGSGSPDAAVRRVVNEIDPELALFDVKTMTERVDLSLSSRRMAMLLALGFGALALFLAGVGLFGVLAYSVARRRRDIGIRMALGGSPWSIARLVFGEASALVGAGLAVGVAASLLLRRVMEGQIYGVRPFEPGVIAGALLLLALAAVAACAVPLVRALRVPPAIVLSE
ncbi:MAG: ABC transporter permease [Bryobacterales bacterium]|nr:ABC transporter permease [Bryobacterales bacterium]